RAQGAVVNRVIVVGGGARALAQRRIAPSVLGCPVSVPAPGEYVADGAARQAAWVLSGEPEPPRWSTSPAEVLDAPAEPQVRERYAEVRELTAQQLPSAG
ncbi:MAG: FGGY-family carbohydrate kinase, partial [Frankiaceae bacterium]